MWLTEGEKKAGRGDERKFHFEHAKLETSAWRARGDAGSSIWRAQRRGLGHRDTNRRAISTKTAFTSVRMEDSSEGKE